MRPAPLVALSLVEFLATVAVGASIVSQSSLGQFSASVATATSEHELYSNGICDADVSKRRGAVLVTVCPLSAATDLPEKESVRGRSLLQGFHLTAPVAGSQHAKPPQHDNEKRGSSTAPAQRGYAQHGNGTTMFVDFFPSVPPTRVGGAAVPQGEQAQRSQSPEVAHAQPTEPQSTTNRSAPVADSIWQQFENAFGFPVQNAGQPVLLPPLGFTQFSITSRSALPGSMSSAMWLPFVFLAVMVVLVFFVLSTSKPQDGASSVSQPQSQLNVAGQGQAPHKEHKRLAEALAFSGRSMPKRPDTDLSMNPSPTPPCDSLWRLSVGSGDLRRLQPEPLCPGLVVPRSSECLLAIPILRTFGPSSSSATFDISDLTGKSVLRCSMRVPIWGATGVAAAEPVLRIFGLPSRQREGLDPAAVVTLPVAYCRVAPERLHTEVSLPGPEHRRTLTMHSAEHEFFGSICQDATRPVYVLTSHRAGVTMIFTGDFEKWNFQVVGLRGEWLAEVLPGSAPFDPEGSYCKIKVAAEVDVGMLMCGVLAIELIELD